MRLAIVLCAVVLASGPARSAELAVPGTFGTIQQAITQAQDGDEVVVQPGTYAESIDFLGKAVVVRSAAGAGVTVIGAPGVGTVVRFVSGEGPASVLRGFTLTNPALKIGDFGVWIHGASPSIEDCALRDLVLDTPECQLFAFGVALLCDGGAPRITRCDIVDNAARLGCQKAQVYGVALAAKNGAQPLLEQCTVARNVFGGDGPGRAACYAMDAGITFQDCVLEDNARGAIHVANGTLLMSGGVVRENHGFDAITLFGGGAPSLLERVEITRNARAGMALAIGAQATLRHCTIADNAQVAPTGFDVTPAFFLWNGALAIEDSIVWGKGLDPLLFQFGATTVRYSDVAGGAPGPGNLALDPAFVDPVAADYRLASGSPCIGAGDPAGAPDPDGTAPDQGAYPYQPWSQQEAGAAGTLTGSGTLLPNTAYAVVLEGAAPHAPFVFVAGPALANLPIPLGVLVPSPQLVLAAGTTDGGGNAQAPGRWPAGAGSGTMLAVQGFVFDGTGFAPTDAAVGVAP